MKDASSYTKLFKRRHILIVEDEHFLADEARSKLEKLGAIVVGPTGNIEQALKIIDEQRVDAAILDIHLAGELVFAVADKLAELGIAFVFATAYNPSIIPDRFPGFLLCEKPLALGQIAKALFAPDRPNR